MSDIAQATACQIVKDALDLHPEVAEAWKGPRSTEVGFRTGDGMTVTVNVRPHEVR